MTLPNKFKEYWDYALHKITNEYPTASRLGNLLHGKSFRYRMSYDMQFITEPRLVLSLKIVAKKEGCGPPEGSSIMPVPGSRHKIK